jgi:3-phosphoshikimate 1-carboxyvinyltransferase
MEKIISKVNQIKGSLRVPSDKSISHRAIILPSLAKGKTYVKNFLKSGDTLSTLNCYRKLGVNIEEKEDYLVVNGVGLFNFQEPDDVLDMGNSGTTTRLTLGAVAPQKDRYFAFTGDDSLRKRPMARVSEPLREMGALIYGREGGNKLPLGVVGNRLKGIKFFNKKSSAQVKSALLIAGLMADGETVVEEKIKSRDHTEKILKEMGADITVEEGDGYRVKIKSGKELSPIELIDVPADPSSAAFFVGASLIVPNSEVLLKDVLINETRDGFYRKLMEVGADIEYTNIREKAGEKIADIRARYSPDMKPIKVVKEEVPAMIDELPLLMLIATQIEGESVFTGAEELRVKESDRIKAVVENLKRLSLKAEELEDGAIIYGKQKVKGGVVDSYHDHRIAMGFSVLGLIAEEGIKIKGAECVFISYPEFYEHLEKLIVN